ncbi:DUF4352 domain-containing protein [Dictyobacter kobayashii]|uniref:DUF4352 domain-containing protein n=1 Tax=Dictyobacter kobayashii TaxID=2014872 RepID=A0A402AF44_9CHLR|nr:DUF4352 domain-containing protein [Dictyobacter kobayashii]GCE17747.1 hypothetical protein KDK_15470 [Dictyobacter kobayashii]
MPNDSNPQNRPDQFNQPFPPNQYNQPGQPFPPNQYNQPGQPFPPNQYNQPGQPGQFNQQYPYNQQPPYTPGFQPPYGQPPVPPKKRSKVGIFVGIIIAVVVLCGVIGGLAVMIGNNTKSTTTTTTPSTSTQTDVSATPQATTAQTSSQPTSGGNNKVGDVVKVNDKWTAQVLDVKTSNGNDMLKPKAGNVYLIVHVSLKNTSTDTLPISSLLCFKLQDKNGQNYNETIYPDAGATPDGKVPANSPLAGFIVYEVPTAQHNFTLQFTPDFIGTDQARWDLSA